MGNKTEQDLAVVPKLKNTVLKEQDTSILFWQAVHKCEETCPIWGDCPYNGNTIKCDMAYRFLNEVKSATLATLEEREIKEFQKHLLGTGLFSLWNQWLQFEIIRISLPSPMLDGKIHPIYKAQRDVLASIRKAYDSIFGKEAAAYLVEKELAVDSLANALREE